MKITFLYDKAVDKGTGLGLSQVYGFAKQSGGEVAASSTFGQGTSFALYLPKAKNIAALNKDLRPEPTNLPSRRVLLVENNEAAGAFAA